MGVKPSPLLAVVFFLVMASASLAGESTQYSVEYRVKFLPEKQQAAVSIIIHRTHHVKSIDFNLSSSRCVDFSSQQTLIKKESRLIWYPAGEQAVLTYRCPLISERPSKNMRLKNEHASEPVKSFDGYINNDWALFRGDDLVPPAKVTAVKGAEAVARLRFELPKDWRDVNTGWPRDRSVLPRNGQKNAPVFLINNPNRKFDRPTGWMIAGKIGTRRAFFGDNKLTAKQIAVSAPRDSTMRRMDVLTFLQFVWPEFKTVFGEMPQKLLIVGGGDPLWRGGLSAGNSFFMHADRPLVSENGTSTLLHEMVHMVSGVRGAPMNDWIAEGIAEYYSIELLYRAGGINTLRREAIYTALSRRAASVTTLNVKRCSGRTTAAAVIVFDQLDTEIKQKTNNQKSLDDVVNQLIALERRISLQDVHNSYKHITGELSVVLQQEKIK